MTGSVKRWHLAVFAVLAIFSFGSWMALPSKLPPPPARFDKPYRGNLKITEIELSQVRLLCRGEIGLIGCADVMRRSCHIILPKIDGWIVTQEVYDAAKRHEIGHCNGWGKDHLDQ